MRNFFSTTAANSAQADRQDGSAVAVMELHCAPYTPLRLQHRARKGLATPSSGGGWKPISGPKREVVIPLVELIGSLAASLRRRGRLGRQALLLPVEA